MTYELAFIGAGNMAEAIARGLLKSGMPGSKMIATEVASPFITPFKTTFFVALFLAMPVVIYQAWAFVAPGLYRGGQCVGQGQP